ncbi:dynein light chain Tctex-type 5-like [Porites lutea]|uniref:dynein light chain Tctex-type 5-like n=1 Tax=Porites lutea TaxID=51062 RepID=UPI003CC68732
MNQSGLKEPKQQRTSWDNSAQRRVSVESFSDQKHSQDSSSPRRSSRRISGAMYFSNFKRPNETKDNVQARKNTFENTYRLEPKTRFPEIKVKAVLNEVLEKLESHTYSPTHSPFLVKLLSTRVLEKVKRLNIERYKIVCLVTIGSKASQGLRIASRCLWND